MPDIPHRISAPRERVDDLIATTGGSDSYHADLTINAPIDTMGRAGRAGEDTRASRRSRGHRREPDRAL